MHNLRGMDCVLFFFKVFFFFLMWTNFKVSIEFVTILLLLYILVFWPQGMWDLSCPTRDRTNPHLLHWMVKS